MSNISSTEKKRRFIMFCLLGITMTTTIVVLSIMLFTPEQAPSTSQIVKSREDTIQGGVGGSGSAEYNRKLEEHDTQQADVALQAGESFIPTPVGQRRPAVQKKEDTPPPPPPIVPPRTAPVQAPRNNSAMLKAMMEDLATLDSKLASFSISTGKIAYVTDFEDVLSPIENAGEIAQTPTDMPSLEVKAGDILYAIVDTGVNSDVPSAVMATVISGKYKNTRLLGSFQRFEERLVLTFSRALLPNGQSVQLEAYAIDPKTTEASVASSVNTHFFSRWGGLIAASFLEGFGEATKFSGAESVNNAFGESTGNTVFQTYSVADQAWIAAGKVGERTSEIFERNFDRPPTVYLESGANIGVLILNVSDERG